MNYSLNPIILIYTNKTLLLDDLPKGTQNTAHYTDHK